jgi:hypothetical protein
MVPHKRKNNCRFQFGEFEEGEQMMEELSIGDFVTYADTYIYGSSFFIKDGIRFLSSVGIIVSANSCVCSVFWMKNKRYPDLEKLVCNDYCLCHIRKVNK